MLFMIIERFKGADDSAVGQRFKEKGRMLPEGVEYVASWLEPRTGKCYQLMQAPSRGDLDVWIARWSDVVDFEVDEVLTSADYWAMRGAAEGPAASA